MTVTITKSKTKAKAKQVHDVLAASALAYATRKLALEAKLAKLAALAKEVTEAETELLRLVDEQFAKDKPAEIEAGQYVVKVGAKGQKAVAFDNVKIKSEVGAETFDAIATFKVEDLKRYMTGDAFAEAVTYDHVNKRKVTIAEAEDK